MEHYECLYHPIEPITNFCVDPHCLLPLCPTCVGEHSAYHKQHRSHPNYQNIYDTIITAQQSVHEQIQLLRSHKQRNTNLILRVERLPNLLREKIQLAKSILSNAIEQAFNDLQHHLLNTLGRLHTDLNLYSMQSCLKVQRQIIQSLDNLYDIDQGLKTKHCLYSLIKYYKDVNKNASQILSSSSHFLNTNQNYAPIVEISSEMVKTVTAAIFKSVKIDPKQAQIYAQRTFGNNNNNNAYHRRKTTINSSQFAESRPRTYSQNINVNTSTKLHRPIPVTTSNSHHKNQPYLRQKQIDITKNRQVNSFSPNRLNATLISPSLSHNRYHMFKQ